MPNWFAIKSTPSENLQEEPINCVKCKFLKNEIIDLHNTLGKFIKGRENLNTILSNQKGTYNKSGLGYQF